MGVAPENHQVMHDISYSLCRHLAGFPVRPREWELYSTKMSNGRCTVVCG